MIFRKIIFFYAPLFVWMGLIFFLSSIPGFGYSEFNLLVFLERKGAHIFEYLVLGFLSSRVFWVYLKDEENQEFAWGILLSFFWAVFDEIHQLFVFGREGKISDVFIDLIGILLGAGIFLYFAKRRKRIFYKNQIPQ